MFDPICFEPVSLVIVCILALVFILLVAYNIGWRVGTSEVLKCLDIYDAAEGVPLWRDANSFFADCRSGCYPSGNYCRITIHRENGPPLTIRLIGTHFPLDDASPIPLGVSGELGNYVVSGEDLNKLLITAGVPQGVRYAT